MLDDLRFRVRALFRRRAVEQELDEELRFHFDRQVEKFMKTGLAEEEAKRRARLLFGGHEQVKEDRREVRGTGFIGQTLQDAQYAFRQLWANPTFTLVILLTLALSIGANSAIFSVIDGVLLKRLPYRQPDRLVRIFLSSREYPKFPLNPFDFLDFRARNHSFDSMAAFTRGDVQLSGEGEPVRLNGFGVTSGYFRVLGLQPELGREFDFKAEIPGNGLQVILSHRVWQTRFGGDPQIIGRKITMNMQPFTVIGVMPAGTEHPGNDYHAVAYGDSVDVWWPFSFAGDSNRRGSHFIEGIGRLKEQRERGERAGRDECDHGADWPRAWRQRLRVVGAGDSAVHGDRGLEPPVAAGAAGGGGDRAVDCLRECGESADGESLGAAARNRGAAGIGCAAIARGAATADGEPADCTDGRGAGADLGIWRRAGAGDAAAC